MQETTNIIYCFIYIISCSDDLHVCSCVFSTIDLFLPALVFTKALFPIQFLFSGHNIRSCNHLSNVFVTGSFGDQMLLIYQIMDVL